jgi:hypothetical protein
MPHHARAHASAAFPAALACCRGSVVAMGDAGRSGNMAHSASVWVRLFVGLLHVRPIGASTVLTVHLDTVCLCFCF